MILHYVYHCLSKVAPFWIFFGGLLQCNRQLLLVAASQKWFIKTLRGRLDMTPMSPGCLFCLRECQNQKSPSMAQLFAIVAEIMSCYIMNASGTYFYGCCILFSVWLLYYMLLSLRPTWSRLTSVLPWLPIKGSAYQEGREFYRYGCP